MSKQKENIHDSNFKHNFCNKRVAKDFFIHNLPKKIREKVVIDSIEIESNEFIPSKYRGRRNADIIYSLKDRDNKKLYVLLHLEAQSTHKKEMAVRVWEYHAAIARAHIRKEGSKKMPVILSYILYNGSQEWTSAKSIADLFEDFDLYVEVSLKTPFLINLSKEGIENLKNQGAAAAPQIIMRGKAHHDYCDILEELYPLMEKYDQVDEENIDYMATYDEHGEMEFLEKLSKFAPDNTQKYKTMFERAIQRTAKEFETKGKKKGIQQGRKEGMQSAFQILRKLGVSQNVIEKAQREAEKKK